MSKHFLFLLLASSLLAAVLAGGWARSRGSTATAQFSYRVDTPAAPVPAAAYGYDGYYHGQAAESATRTFTAWVSAPEVIAAALRAAQQPVPVDTRQLGGIVGAVQAGPQLVSITVSAASGTAAQAIAQGVQAQATAYAANTQLTLMPTAVLVGGHGLQVGLITLAVFVATGFLGLNLFFLQKAFNEHRH